MLWSIARGAAVSDDQRRSQCSGHHRQKNRAEESKPRAMAEVVTSRQDGFMHDSTLAVDRDRSVNEIFCEHDEA